MNEEELKNVIKIKDSEICLSKIVTHDSTDVVVYFIDKIPYFFRIEKDEQLYPTGKMPIWFTYIPNKTKMIRKINLFISDLISKSLFFVEISEYFAKIFHLRWSCWKINKRSW